AEFPPAGGALAGMGGVVWAKVRVGGGDALAPAAPIAARDCRVEKVWNWSPDKDLAQCVLGDRVVQVDRKGKKVRNADGVREKFGVEPGLIPDFLALVGDAADGYPGIAGIGAVTAARLLNRHGVIENFPTTVLGKDRDRALLFKHLATLRTNAPLFQNVDELEWRGPTGTFPEWTERLGDQRLLPRCRTLLTTPDNRKEAP